MRLWRAETSLIIKNTKECVFFEIHYISPPSAKYKQCIPDLVG